jgi:hypothetical protein
VRQGGSLLIDNAELTRGGAGGTLLSSDAGRKLAIHGARLLQNGGHIRVNDTAFEMRDTLFSGNDIPYGAAINAEYSRANSFALTGSRIADNRFTFGAPQVQISNGSESEPLQLDIQATLLVGQSGPNLVLVADSMLPDRTDANLTGNIVCNTFAHGANGLSLRSQATQVVKVDLNIHANVFEDHTPPIEPVYIQPRNGLGRGATSELPLDMTSNWWSSDQGPYSADRFADGQGEAVGKQIVFDGWLLSRPPCAPPQ